MSLDTVLKIGKALRKADDNLKHFKYVSPCPLKDGNYPFCISIPITEDFTFDWDNIREEINENTQKELYYLAFKTSDRDNRMKYIFGDIYYSVSSKITKNGSIETDEKGGYRLGNTSSTPPFDKSSFERAYEDFEDIVKNTNREESVLIRFRINLQKQLSILEKILDNISAIEYYLSEKREVSFIDFIENENLVKDFSVRGIVKKTPSATLKKLGINIKDDQTIETLFSNSENGLTEVQKEKLLQFTNGEIFVHFKFPQEKHWYNYKNELDLITQKMLSDFVEYSDKGIVLRKTLYKTLCSGDKTNDIQFPNFELDARYKAKYFSEEEMQDLFYAIDFSKKGKLIQGTDIKIIVLPKGEKENLTEYDYVSFQKSQDEREVIRTNNKKTVIDPSFIAIHGKVSKNITSFDVIFSKKGGATSPDVDLVEISGINKSSFLQTIEYIEEVKETVYENRKKYFSNIKEDLNAFEIASSFRNLLGSPQSDLKTGKVIFKANPRYQSHLLKILPLIYTNNYNKDDQLMPSFLQNVEFSVRAGNSKYGFLKFDLEFLISIQNNQTDKFMKIIDSPSYQVGKKMGVMAKPLKKVINSFEKNYVGLLTRRTNSLNTCIEFINELDEKGTMHGKTWAKNSSEARQMLSQIDSNDYNKEYLAFGFFEGYFTYEVSDDKTKLLDTLEKLVSDYSNKEDLEEILFPIITSINNLKLITNTGK